MLKFDVLCIGAGREQVPGIQVALRMGLTVLALDGNAEAPGLAVATRGIHVDLRDTGQVVSLARDSGVRAVIPVPLGLILATTGVVNDTLHLRGVSAKAAHLCTDKLAMRDALVAAGLPQPAYRLVSSAREMGEAALDIGYPLVVKPRRGSGSRGVRLLAGEKELAHEGASEPEVAAPGTREMMVETAMPGTEYGMDGVVVGNEFTLLALRAKDLTPPPHRVAVGYTGPVRISEPVRSRLVQTLQRACEALEITDSLLHADIMIDEDGTVGIIEISARPSGYGLSQVLLPATTGIQPTEQALRMLTGMEFSFEPTRGRIGVLRTLLGHASVVSDGEIIKARGLAGVEELSYVPSSSPRAPIVSGSDAYEMGHAIIVGDTLDDVEATWQEMRALLGFAKDEHGHRD